MSLIEKEKENSIFFFDLHQPTSVTFNRPWPPSTDLIYFINLYPDNSGKDKTPNLSEVPILSVKYFSSPPTLVFKDPSHNSCFPSDWSSARTVQEDHPIERMHKVYTSFCCCCVAPS